MYILPVEYLTCDLASKTKFKSIKDAYDRNNLSVILCGSVWHAEACSERVFRTVYREMKRLYPEYTYLGDL